MPTANPRPEAPDAGSALPTPDRDIRELFDIAIAGDRLARRTGNSFMLSLEKVAAFCRCSRSEAVPILRKIMHAMDGAEAAIEAALADATPPVRAAAAGDEASDDEVYEWCRQLYEKTGGATPALRQAHALYQAWEKGAAHAAPSAGTVTLEEMAEVLYETEPNRSRPMSWKDIVDAADRGVPFAAELLKPDRERAAAILARLSDQPRQPQGQPVRIGYVNWRGEVTTPTIVPTRIFWGSNEWHPEPCWLLEAMDVEKQALRTFDLRKIWTADGGLRPPGTAAAQEPQESFQSRVNPWVVTCFGDEVARDELERMDRFVEEVFEALQARGYDPARIDALKSYVYGRKPGEIRQEIGGVMTTLAAWCNAIGEDMHEAGEVELARIWTKVDKIRAKQAAKPKGSALPIALASAEADDGWSTLDDCPSKGEPLWVWQFSWVGPQRREADGEHWRRMLREGSVTVPTHWCHDRAPPPPASAGASGEAGRG